MEKISSYIRENPLYLRIFVYVTGVILMLWISVSLFESFGTSICGSPGFCSSLASVMKAPLGSILSIMITILAILVGILLFTNYKRNNEEKVSKAPKWVLLAILLCLLPLFVGILEVSLTDCSEFCGILAFFTAFGVYGKTAMLLGLFDISGVWVLPISVVVDIVINTAIIYLLYKGVKKLRSKRKARKTS